MALRIVSPLFDRLPEEIIQYILEFDPNRRLGKLSTEMSLFLPYFFRTKGMLFVQTRLARDDKLRSAITIKRSCGWALEAAAECDQCGRVKNYKSTLAYITENFVSTNFNHFYCDDCINL